MMQLLIDKGADIHARDNTQCTALHIAATVGGACLVSLLLKNGADIHARDNCQRTVLHLAGSCSEIGDADLVQLLLDAGANVHARNDDQETPLPYAAYEGPKSVVPLYMKYGADVNVWDSKQTIVLHNALLSRIGCTDIVRQLLDMSADIHARDGDKRTALHIALDLDMN